MRLGALLLQVMPCQQFRQAWLEAEALGLDVAYVADHLTHPTLSGQWLAEGWTTLSAAAEATTRIELGPLVASAAVRTPVALARAAATVQDVSNGRLILGIGAGTPADAFANHGDEPSSRALADRFADTLAGLACVWEGQPSYQGATLSFDGAVTSPLAAGQRRPPLMVAAHGPRSYRLAALYGDG